MIGFAGSAKLWGMNCERGNRKRTVENEGNMLDRSEGQIVKEKSEPAGKGDIIALDELNDKIDVGCHSICRSSAAVQ